MMQNRPMASLSFDLDNLWSYLRTHGDPGWEAYPSYLDVVLPRMLSVVRKVGLHMTVFVVGKDAETEQHRSLLQRIPKEGHEVGNHSLHHLQWLHKLPHAELRREIVESDRLIHEATGCKPRGFRGPGFACSESLLRILAENGYDYDGSTFPTFLGPIARAYYFFSSRRFSAKEADERKDLFGGVSDGLRPLSLYCWALDSQHHGNPTTDLVEIPVTTMPLLRAPFHMSYLLFLAQKSPFFDAAVCGVGAFAVCTSAHRAFVFASSARRGVGSGMSRTAVFSGDESSVAQKGRFGGGSALDAGGTLLCGHDGGTRKDGFGAGPSPSAARLRNVVGTRHGRMQHSNDTLG